jgi:TRAP-type uncharacterized transport system substrate-binding protein
MTYRIQNAFVIFGTIFTATGVSDAAAQQALINRGVVEIETGTSADISIKIAEDLASIVDDGATRRVVPIIGKGAIQNLLDLKYLRGVDMAILPSNILKYAQRQLPLGNDPGIYYVTKLYNEELHVLARTEIKSLTDLANKKINVDLPGSVSAITAEQIFAKLNLQAILTNDRPDLALEKLRRGELEALLIVSGKPVPLFASIKTEDGLHLLSVPYDRAGITGFLPAQISASDYPPLVPSGQPIESIAIGSVLAVADLRFSQDRYRNAANFVEAFFTRYQSLLTAGHHPKWREVNFGADLPAWRRFPPAEEWLARNQQVISPLKPDDLRSMFSRYLDERRRFSGSAPMTSQEKDDLFEQFRAWQTGQNK